MTDLKSLIAKARTELEGAEPTEVPVEVAGELVKLAFRPVTGYVWADLTATHPPRHGSVLDGNVGFNSDAVAKDYPLDKITVNGEPVDAGTWAELCEVLTAPAVRLVAAALWGINHADPAKRVAELGKARPSAGRKKRN